MVSVVTNAVKSKKKNQGKTLLIQTYQKSFVNNYSIMFCSDLLDLYEKASKGGKVSLESFFELAENHSIQVVG